MDYKNQQEDDKTDLFLVQKKGLWMNNGHSWKAST